MEPRKKKGSSFLAVVALLGCVALGYCFGVTTSTTPEQAKAEREKTAKRPPADVGEAATVKALRARIAELERQLAKRSAAKLPEVVTAVTNAVAEVRAGRGDPGEWLENMKKNNPERYAQMTNRFEQFRLRRAERQQRNLDFLSSVDTSRMSASARKTHVALQEAMIRREELLNQVREVPQDPAAAEADRREFVRQMRENEEELRRLRQEERVNLFEATANSLGFEGEDAREIVETLKEVVDSTDSAWHHMGPPPGGRRRPGNR